MRQILTLLWTVLSTSSSSGVISSSRPTIQQAISHLCFNLYDCLDVQLLEEAELKGTRVSKQLEIILNSE